MSTPPGADPLAVALPYPDPPVVSGPRVDDAGADDTAMVVSEEQWRVGTEWVVSGRVRLRRRIVTEYRTVEVAVRREIVEVAGDTVDFRDGHLVGVGLDGPPVAAPAPSTPFVAVLREEVPVVTVQVRPYERFTVTTTRVQDAATVHDTVRREQLDVTVHPHQPAEEN